MAAASGSDTHDDVISWGCSKPSKEAAVRVEHILRKLVRGCRSVHKTRAQAVFEVVAALVACRRLTLASLGRALRRPVAPKHCIKRVDRLIGNWRLRRDAVHWYAAMAKRLIGDVKRPLLLLDWVEVDRMVSLAVSVPVRGRSVPIYSEAHPKSRYGNRKVVREFLATLRTIVPPRCKPILVADAGFQGPFYELVHELRWGFVARVRGTRRKIRGKRYGDILKRARPEPMDLGPWDAKESNNRWRLVLSKRPLRRRKGDSRARNVEAYRRRYTEAWLLASNEHQASPHEVVEAYAQRMKIEEAFRDLKSMRFGWGLESARTTTPQRLEAKMLIAALATFVTVVAGLIAEDRGLARAYQANTERRRVLSLVTLGRAVLTGVADFRFTIGNFVRTFREELRACFPQRPNREFIDYDIYPF